MRGFLSCLTAVLLVQFAPTGLSGQTQQMFPVRSSSPTASSTIYLRVENFSGHSYASLSQVAAIFNGQLQWKPVSRAVDMRLRGHTIRFTANSSRVTLDGKSQNLIAPTVRDGKGLWVPIHFFGSNSFFRLSGSKLDLDPPAEAKPTPKAKPAVVSEPKARRDELKAAQALRAKAIRRVVIDPGHGGKDPGTQGSRGIEEKTINLLIARELADALREKQGYEVLLTRMDDSFVPLAERAEIANRHNADLFISVHCNASLSSKLKGFEVYFLSEDASDARADATARLENAPLALEGKSVPTPGQLQAVLRSLVKNANINEASALGALIDRHVADRTAEPSLGVKQAAFYVLRGAEMPAVLIETGFLTNPKEERLLQSASFRKKLVNGILAGIAAYDVRKQKERG